MQLRTGSGPAPRFKRSATSWMHAAKGEPKLAREKYEAALAILDRLGERLYHPHTERAVAELQ